MNASLICALPADGLSVRPSIGLRLGSLNYHPRSVPSIQRQDSNVASVSSDKRENQGPVRWERGKERVQLSQEDDFLSNFRRRFVLGTSAAAAVAFGGNLGGITSSLLSLNPEFCRSIKLDAFYPIKGFKRCLEQDFEFIYPDSWVGDQKLLSRAAKKLEKERLLGASSIGRHRNGQKGNFIEPVVAFHPPGSNAELNVSVIVAPVALNFRLEKFGGPKEIGEAILQMSIISRSTNLSVRLINADKHDEVSSKACISYYNLDFSVEGESFQRHYVAVYTIHNGKLFSMNVQAPESLWAAVKELFTEMANSFRVTS